MDCSTPGLSLHHLLPELAQTQVHQTSEADLGWIHSCSGICSGADLCWMFLGQKDAHSAALASHLQQASSGMSLWPRQHRQRVHPLPTWWPTQVRGWGQSPGVEPVALPMGSELSTVTGQMQKCRKGWRTTTDAICQPRRVISQTQCVHLWLGDHPLSHPSGERFRLERVSRADDIGPDAKEMSDWGQPFLY